MIDGIVHSRRHSQLLINLQNNRNNDNDQLDDNKIDKIYVYCTKFSCIYYKNLCNNVTSNFYLQHIIEIISMSLSICASTVGLRFSTRLDESHGRRIELLGDSLRDHNKYLCCLGELDNNDHAFYNATSSGAIVVIVWLPFYYGTCVFAYKLFRIFSSLL